MISFVHRFHGHSSLRYVYKNGQAVRSRLMTIKAIDNPHRKIARIAVVVSKKVIKSAVSRNRIRRRIYEYVRLQLPELREAQDIAIIVSSSEVLTMPYDELSECLKQLFIQAKLYKSSHS